MKKRWAVGVHEEAERFNRKEGLVYRAEKSDRTRTRKQPPQLETWSLLPSA